MEKPGGICYSPRQQRPIRMLLSLMNTFLTQWTGISSRLTQEMIITTKPRMTEAGCCSSSDLIQVSNMSDQCQSGLITDYFPEEENLSQGLKVTKRKMNAKLTRDESPLGFTGLCEQTEQWHSSWNVGNCNGMRLREMNINYTWRMINGLQNDSYNPRRGTAGHWWLFTKDYSLIYCSSPNANNKLKIIG